MVSATMLRKFSGKGTALREVESVLHDIFGHEHILNYNSGRTVGYLCVNGRSLETGESVTSPSWFALSNTI